ncbi:spermidine/putrescine ABC transporter substrate-binding protein [Actinobacillus delphinicola]|uniref:Putrescine-binding periplasmic protein n=1 Tax=Actinobacillus delphinicola TaxID=51161 RepID=A0A448TUA5_9PAST|nr:extracellular solute-binding protein [Actinobacillus delphinicola]MDG6897695.1 spermidine/putrescine ABC transporter substrate-binding protein [Actinobacillus delphinicola]VEJ09577.1 extracellular solute-binding protein [Actinobacillus delphinicola]
MKKFILKGMKSLMLTACALVAVNASAADNDLYVYNWTDYIPSDLVSKFTKETGIKVIYSTFESNEEMYAKLKLLAKDGEGYDLVFPSSYYIDKMASEGLLQPIDHSKIPNFHYIPKEFLNQSFDPNNKYSLPYTYGLTGIGVNSAYIDPKDVTSWADLWNPKYKGQVLLTNDAREVFHIALLLDGDSPNTRNPDQIKAAYERLLKLMPNVLVFNSDSPEVPFVQGEVNIGMLWNGSAYLANKEDPDIKFIYPKEGAILWMDNYAIPSTAKHVANAYKFINFLLRPENAKEVIERMGFSMPNNGVKALLTPELANNPILFPPKAQVEKGVVQADVGPAVAIYQKYWELLKAQFDK